MYLKAKIELPNNGWPHPDELPKYHAEDITQYCDEVLLPTLCPLEKYLTDAYYGNFQDPEPTCEELNSKQLLQSETAKGLFLALGSVWERQLRNYLFGYALKLDDVELRKLALSNNRPAVLQKIEQFTGVTVEPENSRLAEYSLVANVCRHGMGKSLTELYENYRENWWYSNHNFSDDSPMLWNMQIRADDIKNFALEIKQFWVRDCRTIADNENGH